MPLRYLLPALSGCEPSRSTADSASGSSSGTSMGGFAAESMKALGAGIAPDMHIALPDLQRHS